MFGEAMLVLALTVLLSVVPVAAAPGGGGTGGNPALQQCQASLNTCTANLSSANANLTSCTATLNTANSNLSTCNANYSTCSSSLSTANANLTSCNANYSTCSSSLSTCNSDLSQAQADLATCQSDLTACQVSAQSFPATGQTSCWDSSGTSVTCAGTGQDGDVKAGAVLSYDATTDGGLTITDNNTKLVWEKKTYCLVADPTNDPHCYGNLYTWQAALDYIKALNDTRFAGHNDWRLPNVKELLSIVNYQGVNPAVSSAFNVCGSTPGSGSCTIATSYWSSSVYA